MIQNTGYVKIPGGRTLELVDSLRLKWGILELMIQFMPEPSDIIILFNYLFFYVQVRYQVV